MNTIEPDPPAATDNETTRWRLDPARSSVEFRVRNLWGLQTVHGRFARFDGTLRFEGTPTIELTIDARSVETGNARRDGHLRSADFFDTQRHPQVRFVSDGVTLDGERLDVGGRLHAAGASIAIEPEATLERVGDELVVHATAHVDHRGLGMTWSPLGMVRPPAALIVRGRLVRDTN